MKQKLILEKALNVALTEHRKDEGGQILLLQRRLKNYPRITIKIIPQFSPIDDSNVAPFILSADIAANPAKHLQSWLID